MTLVQQIDHPPTEKELGRRCAKFFEVARYAALDKARKSGDDPADIYQLGLSEGIEQILKSVVDAGSMTGCPKDNLLLTQKVRFVYPAVYPSAFSKIEKRKKPLPH